MITWNSNSFSNYLHFKESHLLVEIDEHKIIVVIVLMRKITLYIIKINLYDGFKTCEFFFFFKFERNVLEFYA